MIVKVRNGIIGLSANFFPVGNMAVKESRCQNRGDDKMQKSNTDGKLNSESRQTKKCIPRSRCHDSQVFEDLLGKNKKAPELWILEVQK